MFRAFFMPFSEAGVQFRQWLKSPGYAPVDGRTTMSSESLCQVARSWVNVGGFRTRL
jgi:hypothetical protein